jgi:pimeloyl-ACP methyl ester carboxylesterase
MLQKKYFLLFIILLPFSTHCTENLDAFYSMSFLKNYTAVRESLKEHGFTAIKFKTSDNFTLHGLFLSRPNATCNVIVSAGWLPGKKEGMATFYALLPDYCNILLFDARGHGESEGSLLWKLWEYGVHEYKDILGAISYLNHTNDLPIIITGICSGAFNAAHAIIHLEKNNKTVQSKVKGLIFDSGWGSVTEISRTAPLAGIEKRLPIFFLFMYKTKNETRQSFIYKLCSFITQNSCKIGYYFCTKQLVGYHEQITTLFDKIHHITSPILFIHSHDDTYAIKSDALRLSKLAPHAKCWWIEKSYHAKHHLIHREVYKEKLAAFINEILQ